MDEHARRAEQAKAAATRAEARAKEEAKKEPEPKPAEPEKLSVFAGRPPATVRSRFFRARAQLREALARDVDRLLCAVDGQELDVPLLVEDGHPGAPARHHQRSARA